jgi:hypothetical protein
MVFVIPLTYERVLRECNRSPEMTKVTLKLPDGATLKSRQIQFVTLVSF